MSSTDSGHRGRPRRTRRGGDPGRRQQRPAPGARPRGPRRRRARAARRSPTRREASTPTTTPPSGRRCSATTTPTSTAAVAAVGRSLDLMGVGVTRVEVELAEQLVAARAVAREGAAHLDRQRGDVPRAARRARRHRPPPRDQVPGLLPRLARLGRDERDLARRAGGRARTRSPGDPARGDRRDDRLPVQRRRRRSSGRSTEHDVAAIILELIPHNIGAVLPQPGFLERLRELATEARHRARSSTR